MSRVDRLNAALDAARQDAASIQGEMARVVARVLRTTTRYAADRLQAYATPIALVAVGNTDPHADPTSWGLPDADEVLPADYVREQLDKGLARFRTPLVRSVMEPPLEAFGLHFDERNPLVVGVLGQLGQRITHVSEGMRRDVMASLESSHADGESIPDAAARLVADLGSPDVSQARGELIARTEFLGAANASSLAAAMLTTNGGDQGERKFWIATGDDRTRDTHLQAADDYSEDHAIALADVFAVGDDQLRYPGDPDGSPAEVINCRCTLGYTDTHDDAATEPEPVVDPSVFQGPDEAQAGAGGDQPLARQVILQAAGDRRLLNYVERGPGQAWTLSYGKAALYRERLQQQLDGEVARAREALAGLPKKLQAGAENKANLVEYVGHLDAHEAALRDEIARAEAHTYKAAIESITTNLAPLSDRVSVNTATAVEKDGTALSARRQDELSGIYRDGLGRIDQLLRLPAGRPSEVDAIYSWSTGRMAEVMGNTYGRFQRLTANVEMNVDTPLLRQSTTLVHEYGHYVDSELWGEFVRGGMHYASEHPELLPTTALRERMLDVMQAAYQSDAQVGMRSVRESMKGRGEDVKWHDYALAGREVWARAFAQYVAESSGDATMIEQVHRVTGYYASYAQWTEADFAPIKAAMDALFKEAGWLVG